MNDSRSIDSHMDFISLLSLANLDIHVSESSLENQNSTSVQFPAHTHSLWTAANTQGMSVIKDINFNSHIKDQECLSLLKRKRDEDPDSKAFTSPMEVTKKMRSESPIAETETFRHSTETATGIESATSVNSNENFGSLLDTKSCGLQMLCSHKNDGFVNKKMCLHYNIIKEASGDTCSYMLGSGLPSNVTECSRCLCGEPGHLDHILQSHEANSMDTS